MSLDWRWCLRGFGLFGIDLYRCRGVSHTPDVLSSYGGVWQYAPTICNKGRMAIRPYVGLKIFDR